ncbi:hypothetical protein BN1708_014552 [Verticillium longisporum]|uniref:Uncharacterized protein n=1 Tax=Verticillium longisporum TaxID=100787 RepID=A0A0G4LX56_VERLO|nr:hypothetical protein BN1708_014552 [Verticillium longisporum]
MFSVNRRMSTNRKDGPTLVGKLRAFSSGTIAHVDIHNTTSGPYEHLDYDDVMTGCPSTNSNLE